MVFDDGGTAYTAEHRQHRIRGQQRLRSHQLPVARAERARPQFPPPSISQSLRPGQAYKICAGDLAGS